MGNCFQRSWCWLSDGVMAIESRRGALRCWLGQWVPEIFWRDAGALRLPTVTWVSSSARHHTGVIIWASSPNSCQPSSRYHYVPILFGYTYIYLKMSFKHITSIYLHLKNIFNHMIRFTFIFISLVYLSIYWYIHLFVPTSSEKFRGDGSSASVAQIIPNNSRKLCRAATISWRALRNSSEDPEAI